MDTLDALLASIEQAGIRLHVERGRLRYTASPGALTQDLKAELQRHKLALIERFQNAPVLHPPSFAQRRFWTLQQLNRRETFYNVRADFSLRGPLDEALLKSSFNAVAARHEILHTRLCEVNGQLMQVIAPDGEIPWTDAEVSGPFDLASEVGIRAKLTSDKAGEYLLQLCLHNVLYDQTSFIVLLKEVSRHYASLASGWTTNLLAPAQYSEYVRWQASLPACGMEGRRQYWEAWFRNGVPPPWTWICRKPAPAKPGFESHATWTAFSPVLTQQIKAMSQRHGVTTYIVLITAYMLTQRRYTGCTDLTVGTTYANRPEARFNSMIGPALGVPAIRVDMGGNLGLSELLERVKQVIAEALTFQDIPGGMVDARVGDGPLFRTVFSFFADTLREKLTLPGIEVTYLERESISTVSRPDVYLVMWENHTPEGAELAGYWLHRKDVFTVESAEEMNREFSSIVDGMVAPEEAGFARAAQTPH